MRHKVVVSVATFLLALAGVGGYLLNRATGPASGANTTGQSTSRLECTLFPGLPPSMDNDAGHARGPDTTPDADCDWAQTHGN